jgi:hypothetical protein
MQYAGRPAEAMHRHMYELCRIFDRSMAADDPAVVIERQHIARPHLGPVKTEGREIEAIGAAGDHVRQMIVDSLVVAEARAQSVACGQIDACLGPGILE